MPGINKSEKLFGIKWERCWIVTRTKPCTITTLKDRFTFFPSLLKRAALALHFYNNVVFTMDSKYQNQFIFLVKIWCLLYPQCNSTPWGSIRNLGVLCSRKVVRQLTLKANSYFSTLYIFPRATHVAEKKTCCLFHTLKVSNVCSRSWHCSCNAVTHTVLFSFHFFVLFSEIQQTKGSNCSRCRYFPELPSCVEQIPNSSISRSTCTSIIRVQICRKVNRNYKFALKQKWGAGYSGLRTLL